MQTAMITSTKETTSNIEEKLLLGAAVGEELPGCEGVDGEGAEGAGAFEAAKGTGAIVPAAAATGVVPICTAGARVVIATAMVVMLRPLAGVASAAEIISANSAGT